jgi:hypothetical protein
MKIAGLWLTFASVCFWLSWLLMPGVGVTDTDTIFALVGRNRADVYASVILQLASAAAYAPGVTGLLVAAGGRASRALRIGSTLLCVGAMGSAADAIFHLVAFEMTAPGLNLDAMGVVMRRLQGPDLRLLLPFVAALFAGQVALVLALRRRDRLTRAALWLLLSLPVLAVLGAAVVRLELTTGRVIGLAVLGALSGSLALVGVSLASNPRLVALRATSPE